MSFDRFVLFLLRTGGLLILTACITALSIFIPIISDDHFIQGSELIIHGRVQEIFESNKSAERKCYHAVLKVDISEILKGPDDQEKEIYIGLTNVFPQIEIGKELLLVLNRLNKSYYDYCDVEEFSRISLVGKIDWKDWGTIVSIFSVSASDRSSFLVTRCESSDKLFGEGEKIYSEENRSEIETCEVISGNTDLLLQYIQGYLETIEDKKEVRR